MSVTTVDIIGFIAGALISVGLFPQVYKSLVTKHVDDISLPMPIMIGTGSFLWIIYGYLIGSWPVLLTNLIAFISNSTLLVLCLIYKKNR